MSKRTEPANVVTSLVFIFASLILFGFVLAMIFYFQYARDQLAASTAAASSPEALRVVRAHEEEFLANYEYVDKDKGIVRIPIEHSMALEAVEPWHLHAPIAPVPATLPGNTVTTPVSGTPGAAVQ